MEPVPETERMEEFRSSPLPSLRLQSSPGNYADTEQLRKPPTLRRSTDPSPSSPTSPAWGVSSALPYRPRTTSPLAGHARSRSAASISLPMSRTQSLPGVNGAGHILYPPQLRPPSPLGSPGRIRASRKPVDEAFPSSPVRSSVFDTERQGMERSSSPTLAVSTPASTANRYRRPSSPLRHVAHPGSSSPVPPPSSFSAGSSPSIRPYDGLSGSYGMGLTLPSSSVPSTPTSARSRSPSISSLETIPDSPDAEEAAMEAERLAQLKAAADMADGNDSSEAKGRGSLDVPARGRTMNFGSRDKRKRWSVCGAERRGDLDLETIWED
ncbi:hypothetical protein B0T11DRAFT_111804 [Plectosphaerella cucumerina]|uniref:Basic proline-rich protein n=1 Tax=Plectosphaerella cucumerina TaxID=40658 RepID=A0A8K0TIB9_9PEZI|nr:hypothetical protein B0T11DRAFT_111804 [Plectosphaerella cucumerina]